MRVLVADDHPLFRRALVEMVKERPELELVAQSANGREALEEIRARGPDVAVLDVRMPELDGLDVLNAVVRDELRTRIVLLSAFIDRASAYAAVSAGAHGFLSKDANGETICAAIAAVARGQTALADEVRTGLVEEVQARAAEERPMLTAREHEILRLTAGGCSTPDIAERLQLSPATVRTHLQRIYDKLGVAERAAAVAEAMRRGLLD